MCFAYPSPFTVTSLPTPGHAVNTKELSEAMGWSGYSASLHYGGFAVLLEPFLRRPSHSKNGTSSAGLIRCRAAGFCGVGLL